MTTIGEGVVTSTPGSIRCGGEFASCSFEFAKDENVTLTAVASDGYVFSGWVGDCLGTDICTLKISGQQAVEANFVVSGTDITPPTLPMGLLHAVDATELSLAWDPSSDNITDPSQLIYKVYIGDARETLVSESNLAYQVMGSEELYITKTPQETPTIREDITIFFTDEEGWDAPQQDETGLYRFSIPVDASIPAVENYIAYVSNEDDGAYILTAVTAVIEDNGLYIVEARPALLMEISDDYSMGGTVRINPGKIRLTTPEAEELAKKN